MGFRRVYRKYVDIEMSEVDREALAGKHIGWNERSGPHFYEKSRKTLLHRWIYHRMLEEEMAQNGWDRPRFDLSHGLVCFKDGNKKNCRRENLYCDLELPAGHPDQPEQSKVEQPHCSATHGSLPCWKAPHPIIVRVEDYSALLDKHLMWNSGRGAFFYQEGERIYVHRFVFERMCREELWFAELEFLPKSKVGFIDNDMTFCDRDNLFLWSCDSLERKVRHKAKEEARMNGIAWHQQRYELKEYWKKKDEENANRDSLPGPDNGCQN